MKALPTNSSPPLLSLKVGRRIGRLFGRDGGGGRLRQHRAQQGHRAHRAFRLWQIDLAFHHMRASFATEG